jgi:hypothetical protein
LQTYRAITRAESDSTTGVLLRDLRKQLPPSATLVGVDVTSSFLPPDDPGPPAIRYAVHDICDPVPADMANKFDLTHVRFVLAGASKAGIPTALRNLIGSLAPGGWLQIQEMDLSPNSPGRTPAMEDMTRCSLQTWPKYSRMLGYKTWA